MEIKKKINNRPEREKKKCVSYKKEATLYNLQERKRKNKEQKKAETGIQRAKEARKIVHGIRYQTNKQKRE